MIDRIMQWLGVAEQPPLDQHPESVGLFMQGMSIPRISSGAMDIIARQREIENELRAYVFSQNAYIEDLEQRVAQLLAEGNRRSHVEN